MKRLTLPAISLAALMASGLAFAQTSPDQPAQPEMQQKQDGASPTPQTPTAPEAGQSSEQPKEPGVAQQPSDSVTVDAKKAVLATSFIGSSVFTAGDENVGDINDLIFDEKGTIQAVIIGVGGFLGMGEKDVALPLDKITVSRDETNAVKLTITATREELEKAPAFDKTLFLVKAPSTPDASTTPSTPSGGGSTTPQ